MERRIEADVEGWPTRPFEDGYDGLRQLASVDFSGVVRAGGAWLFFVNGKIVGVFEGAIDDVEGAQGTAHKAPHPSLPLLYAMQTEGGDTRAKYYTNDTPISEVDSTLSSGSFTGYVELSENVLSGDYYQLYHGGHSMSVAFVGNSGKMITGEEAFERADDEVGIYEVVDVDIGVMEVPQPEEPETATDESDAGSDESEGVETASKSDAGGDPSPDDTDDESAGSAADDGAAATGGDDGPSAATGDDGSAADDAHAAGSGAADAPTAAEGNPSTEIADEADATDEEDQSDGSASPTAGDDRGATGDSSDGTAAAARATNSATDSSRSPRNEATPEAGSGEQPGADAASNATTSADSTRSASAADRERGTESAAASTPETGSADRSSSDRASAPSAGTGDPASHQRGSEPAAADATDRSAAPSADAGDDASRREDAPRQSEAAWREATTVPALDPDRTEDVEVSGQSQTQTRQQRQSRSTQQGRNANASSARSQSRSSTNTRDSSTAQSASGRSGSSSTRSSGSNSRSSGSGTRPSGSSGRSAATDRTQGAENTLEQEVLEREDRIDRLQQRVTNLEDERDEVTEERDRLQERVDSLTEENESLRGEIRSLEDEIEELEDKAASAEPTPSENAGAGASGGPLTPRAALEGTDLFVRYDSKSAPTLEAAHDGSADATAVNQNLRLDVHTQFEDDGATVDGEPFEAFLQETMAYRFVEWLVRILPYEIRETDSASELRDLYDAIPEIDRVEFHGEVARDAVEGEEGAPSETFDVVVRDKMGEALLVANMNDARDPATGRMIVDLQEGASRVKEHSMALAGAFFVTRSFFEPAALETASEATSGSLLSRDSRASYVKLSRKQGYHLCLVEARGDDLHLNVPEL
ncbi:hypothetical protein L593_00920 [Salinarchaeum sp. Harcht-Bsk1]|uniref:DUF7527 domain-containing protein n=1 Tax=Salinarchaeum sp. Harcht-Bsk1 TaxID=1333523 RepID=UPI00034236E6|nr:hypothetical protein [Salinarchaeum sp. Harcht-Bsk1]AGN00139.1 hypothetical protein L593_00920 [Salinarchaeum sp. Harcht-Bsk1]